MCNFKVNNKTYLVTSKIQKKKKIIMPLTPDGSI